MSVQTNKKKFYIIKLDECKYIGKNDDSSTYLMKDNTVVKIYQDPYKCKRDYTLLTTTDLIHVVPKTYNFCGHYIIREYVKGSSLKKYVMKNGLNNFIALKLIKFLEKIYNYNIRNLNVNSGYIFITSTNDFILIDAEYSDCSENNFEKLFMDFNDLTILNKFQTATKKYNNNLYNKWFANKKA
ncbi:hypothetical protein [Clostridium akagii]|uniref:hypothetical protein n=1 Tax=Clostridium akagii TaxID=91623 RepID=UPI000689B086|nr:hypothetical protein [Clostridium akagii]